MRDWILIKGIVVELNLLIFLPLLPSQLAHLNKTCSSWCFERLLRAVGTVRSDGFFFCLWLNNQKESLEILEPIHQKLQVGSFEAGKYDV